MKPAFSAGMMMFSKLVREIGGVKQAERGAAENISFLRPFQFLADQRGAFKPTCTVAWPPPSSHSTKSRDLRGAPGTIRAFDHDQFAGEFLRVRRRECHDRKTGAGRARDDDMIVAFLFIPPDPPQV